MMKNKERKELEELANYGRIGTGLRHNCGDYIDCRSKKSTIPISNWAAQLLLVPGIPAFLLSCLIDPVFALTSEPWLLDLPLVWLRGLPTHLED